MVALVTGDKAFMCWREPEQVAGEESERGTAEGVGIPASKAFNGSMLSVLTMPLTLLQDPFSRPFCLNFHPTVICSSQIKKCTA